jgi:hypothetical protein
MLIRYRHHFLTQRLLCLRDRHGSSELQLRRQLLFACHHVSHDPYLLLQPQSPKAIDIWTPLYPINSEFPLTPHSYRYDVGEDGTFNNRKTFAYASLGIPDGIHCDTNGNVYSGVGDGVHVWNEAGTLLGKIYLGRFAANFRFAGKGRMVIAAQTELYYVTLAAEGADPEDQF